jgi:hypothetical protein
MTTLDGRSDLVIKDLLEVCTALATAIGVIFVAWQLWQTKRQAVTSFEDHLAREYRDLAKEIPASALLGQELQKDEFLEVRELIYNYIDLTNEQVFLRQIGRVSKETWEYWLDGIKSNLSRQIFARVWTEVKAGVPESFQELRRLEKEAFASDPIRWRGC